MKSLSSATKVHGPHWASHCCLCGLLCSLTNAPDPSNAFPATTSCSRRQAWLARAARLQFQASQQNQPSVGKIVDRLVQLFRPSSRGTLIWIDGADVNTLRSAVGLAQATDATIHVGQSTGSEAMHRVKTSEGWLGTSLAEVATHADLIITLGEGILSEAPLLAERFIKPALAEGRGEWCHIGARTPQASVAAATWSTHWPRANWYDRLTEILLQLQHLPGASPAARGLQPLLHKVREAKYIVWLWDAEEFCDAIDELTLRRLLGICRVLSETARSSLLCLDANVGRTTAQEVLLWLTGCHDTFHFDARRRHHRLPQANRTLEDWQREFERILMVRTIPSPHPLPQLSASHFLVPAESNFPIAGATQSVTLVQAIGFESDGYLMRGDRATIDLCAASGAEQPTTGLPAAADLLDRVRDRIQDESHGHVD